MIISYDILIALNRHQNIVKNPIDKVVGKIIAWNKNAY